MAVIPFQGIQTQDQAIQLLQGYIARTLNSLTSNPLLDGQLLRQVPLNAGANLVSHGLGRNYISWAPMNASALVILAFGKSPDPTKYISVTVSASCTCDIYVF